MTIDLPPVSRSYISRPYPLGATVVARDGGLPSGLNVAVYSETAEAVEVCVFDHDGTESRTRLSERTGHVFHGLVEGAGIGTRYGLRVHGEWDPARGLPTSPRSSCSTPYAIAIEGHPTWGEDVFAHTFDDPNAINDADSAASMPRSVVADRRFDWEDDEAPRTPLDETVVYEVHVKGFTQQLESVPEEIRGTYAGLAHPSAIEYLPTSASRASSSCPCTTSCRTRTSRRRASATTGATTPSASSRRTPTTAPRATAASRSPSSRRW